MQEESSLTVREFAELRGITPTTFYWWRSELRRRSSGLVAVQVVESDAATEPPPISHAPFELAVGSSMTLRIPTGFDVDELRRLVSVLRC